MVTRTLIWRLCIRCHRKHLALVFAPLDAPCVTCVREAQERQQLLPGVR